MIFDASLDSSSNRYWTQNDAAVLMLLDLLFPKKCVGCGEFGRYLCVDCERFLLKNEQLICPVCRVTSFDGETHKKCEGRNSLDGFFAFWQYKGLVKKLIKNLKYRFVRSEAEEVINLGIQRLREERGWTFLKFLEIKPIVIPVPLHKFRENWRGFNQAALLAREFAGRFNLKFSDEVLERVRQTKPQVQLKLKQRERNVKGTFDLSKYLRDKGKVLNQKSFLLIDDVWTTGSTLRDCGGVLKKAGAEKVWALTLAR